MLIERTQQRILLPLVPFAASNFGRIGAADLVPEAKPHAGPAANLVRSAAFLRRDLAAAGGEAGLES